MAAFNLLGETLPVLAHIFAGVDCKNMKKDM
jgi:hypothetical protein